MADCRLGAEAQNGAGDEPASPVAVAMEFLPRLNSRSTSSVELGRCLLGMLDSQLTSKDPSNRRGGMCRRYHRGPTTVVALRLEFTKVQRPNEGVDNKADQ